MFVLVRFFPSEEYQQQFMRGSLYLSSMSEFTKVLPERLLIALASKGNKEADMLLKKQQNDEQRDVFEGTIAGIPKEEGCNLVEIPEKVIASDIRVRAVGYSYCNLLCCCKMRYSYEYNNEGQRMVRWDEPDMSSFGKWAVIIKNPEEFRHRVENAADAKGYHYMSGPVTYHPMFEGERRVIRGSFIQIQREDAISVDSLISGPNIRQYDAFDKWDKYKKQQEWRILVNR